MTRRLMVLAGTVLVAVLALSGVAWAVVEPLTVTKTVPRSGATGIAPTANVKAYFDHDLRKATVTSTTFKIRKKGTTVWLGATRSVNNAISPAPTNANSQSVAKLNPDVDLAQNTTYQVMIAGRRFGVKGVDGQALERNKVWAFTTEPTTISARN
jgi:hypothetical protein